MPSDNIYGAPASGLGQNVSFSFQGGGGVPAIQPSKSGQSGQSGISNVGAPNVNAAQDFQAPVKDDSLELLYELGAQIIKPKLAEIKADRLLAGMQAAAAGTAIADIAEAEPWYASVFGNLDAVEGARAYYSQANAQQAVADAEEAMPELAKLSPGEAQLHFKGMVEKQLTGDTAADSAIMQAYIRQMPALMRSQTKAHVAYQQGEAVKAMTLSTATGLRRLQQLSAARLQERQDAQDGPPTGAADRVFDEESKSIVAGLMPPPGVNQKVYSEMLTDVLGMTARTGGLVPVQHLINVGFVDQYLTPDQRVKLDTSLRVGQGAAERGFIEKHGEEVTQLLTEQALAPASMTARDWKNKAERLNDIWRIQYGGSAPFIGVKEMAGGLVTFDKERQRQINEVRAQGLAAAKENAANAKQVADRDRAKMEERLADEMRRTAVLTPGGVQRLLTVKGESKETIRDAIRTAGWDTLEPKQRVALMATALKYDKDMVNPALVSSYRTAIQSARQGGDPTNPAFAQAIADADLMLSADSVDRKPELLGAYFGDQADTVLDFIRMRNHASTKAGPVSGTLYAFKETFGRVGGREPNAKSKALIDGAIDRMVVGRWEFGTTELHPSAKSLIYRLIGDDVHDEDDVRVRYGNLETNGLPGAGRLRVAGKYAYTDTPDQLDITTFYPDRLQPGDSLDSNKPLRDEAFEAAIADVSKDGEVKTLHRLKDQDGRAWFMAVVTDGKGGVSLPVFSTAEVNRHAERLIKEEEQGILGRAKEAVLDTFGSKGSVLGTAEQRAASSEKLRHTWNKE